jgi:hypothetical protein
MNEDDQTDVEEVEAEDVTQAPMPPEDPRDMIREARALVPVGPTGIAPMNLAQMIDFGQSMAKARYSIPEHMQGNPGDCIAIIDIATRADLSPYMLALQTYVDPKTKRLAFMSQAYHALVFPWIIGELEMRYEGEGDEMICIVSGILKSDPKKVREHRSEPLIKARPARNDSGQIKGSPLWDRKPKVQLFYDTSRDWVRLHCPRATLGIYTPEEFAEYGADFARDVTPASPGLSKRLRSGKGVSKKEGNGASDAKAEVDKAKNGATKATDSPAEPAKEAKAKAAPKRRKDPKTPAEWTVATQEWIEAGTDPDEMEKRWKDERDLRNKCGVISDQRAPVEAKLRERVEELLLARNKDAEA